MYRTPLPHSLCLAPLARAAALALLFALLPAASSLAQRGILGGLPELAGTLELREFTDIPGAGPLIDLNHAPGDNRVFVVQQDFGVYAVSPDGATITTFLDSNAALTLAGRTQNNFLAHSGIRSVAFHPEFQNSTHAGYGKFYTSIMQDSIGGPLLGSSPSLRPAESVLVEWTADVNTGLADPTSYRELFRVGLPVYDHTIKRIRFNEYAQPGDEDYGLLYIAHGDAGYQYSGTGQVGGNALGKLLRIDPLDPDGADPATYSIPSTNPFVDDPNVLDEVYALGFRNPHNFDWQKDSSGTPHLVLVDIGQDLIEEINIVEAGKNYGWRLREGTFVNVGGNAQALAPGTADTAGFTFPVAQFGHYGSATAIFGGYVLPSGPNAGEYVFGDFSKTNLYHVTLDELLTQVTEGPSEGLTQVLIEEFAGIISNGEATYFRALLDGSNRSDARMGRGPDGTIYITNKVNGKIFILDPQSLLSADTDGDGDVDTLDITTMYQQFTGAIGAAGGKTMADGDTDGDGDVDTADLTAGFQQFTGTQAAAVPEPGAFALILLGLVGLVLARRHSLRCHA